MFVYRNLYARISFRKDGPMVNSNLSLGNILVLRGDITIAPPERTSVSYEFLSQLVADYLLHASPDVDISAALSMMPLTQSMSRHYPLCFALTIEYFKRAWI